MSQEEILAHPGYRRAILDSKIREAIQERLREIHRGVPLILYTLSTQGRADHAGREGFTSAQDVIDWLKTTDLYPEISQQEPLHALPAAEDVWLPVGRATHPQWVFSRHGSRERFNYERLIADLRRDLLGRPNSDRTATCVAEWVLWSLVGQPSVSTSQLAIEAMGCLRRVDDIAYLRAAIATKRIKRVADFYEEAAALVEHPSVRLIFSASSITRARNMIPPAQSGTSTP